MNKETWFCLDLTYNEGEYPSMVGHFLPNPDNPSSYTVLMAKVNQFENLSGIPTTDLLLELGRRTKDGGS